MPAEKKSRLAWKVIAAILVGIGLHVVFTHLPVKIQKHYGDLFHAAIVLLVGWSISYFFEGWLKARAESILGSRRNTSFRFLGRLILYLAVTLALLAAFGVGLSSLVFGSAFLTVILGLAGQNFFSNLIAGIGLVFFRPFDIGDRINFATWQFTVLMPSFPHEKMKETYTGIVRDINLAYTTLESDDGVPMLVPNGIMIQAYVENLRNEIQVPFRLRFDLDLAINPEQLLSALTQSLKSLPYPVNVQLIDVGQATFGILLTGKTRQRHEDAVRHDILQHLIPIVQELRTVQAAPN